MEQKYFLERMRFLLHNKGHKKVAQIPITKYFTISISVYENIICINNKPTTNAETLIALSEIFSGTS